MLPSVKSTDSANILASSWLAWRWNCNLAYQMEYFPHSRDVCPIPIWEWKTGLERGWTGYCTHATWEFSPPPIHFQVNFDSFDGYILTGWNFFGFSFEDDSATRLAIFVTWLPGKAESQWCWITNVAEIPLIQWFHLNAGRVQRSHEVCPNFYSLPSFQWKK